MRRIWLALLLLGLAAFAGCARKIEQSPWQPVALGTDASFDDIWFTDERNGWVVGGGWDIQGGIIGRTRDGGATWDFTSGLVPGAERYGFGAVQFFDSLSGCVVGSDGGIFRTDDAGENWRRVRSGGGERLGAAHFVDRWNGWAVGTGVLHTVDGGESWEWLVRSNSRSGYDSGEGVFFLDPSNGWMSGHSSLMRTYDGGRTWTAVPLPLAQGESTHLRDIHFSDARHGWVVGESGTILATTDGGSTWVRQTQGIPVPTPRPPHVVRRQHGLDTLPDIEGPPPGLHLMAVRFLDRQRGWTVGFFPWEGRSVVLRTEDGGASWVEDARAPGEELRALFLAPDGRAWTVGDRVREGGQVLLRRSVTSL